MKNLIPVILMTITSGGNLVTYSVSHYSATNTTNAKLNTTYNKAEVRKTQHWSYEESEHAGFEAVNYSIAQPSDNDYYNIYDLLILKVKPKQKLENVTVYIDYQLVVYTETQMTSVQTAYMYESTSNYQPYFTTSYIENMTGNDITPFEITKYDQNAKPIIQDRYKDAYVNTENSISIAGNTIKVPTYYLIFIMDTLTEDKEPHYEVTNGLGTAITYIEIEVDIGETEVIHTTEVIDLPNIIFTILTMPFTFISQAFNLTLFEGTGYDFNVGNFMLGVLAVLILLWLIKTVVSAAKKTQ